VTGRNLAPLALVAFLASSACSFRGGDFTPTPKEPDTPCYKEAKELCKDKLGSADLGNCIARENYRCEVVQEEQNKQPGSDKPQP
jgi:hypothetical protein